MVQDNKFVCLLPTLFLTFTTISQWKWGPVQQRYTQWDLQWQLFLATLLHFLKLMVTLEASFTSCNTISLSRESHQILSLWNIAQSRFWNKEQPEITNSISKTWLKWYQFCKHWFSYCCPLNYLGAIVGNLKANANKGFSIVQEKK